MKRILSLFSLLSLSSLMTSCDLYQRVNQKARRLSRYESVALTYAKENRQLKAQISQLQYEMKALEAKNNFLKIKLEKFERYHQEDMFSSNGRQPQSMKGDQKQQQDPRLKKRANFSSPRQIQNDIVRYNVYQWGPKQLLAIAETAFQGGDYEKAAQYFHTFIREYYGHKDMTDQVLFMAGVSAYKSGNHYLWALDYLGRLIQLHPSSQFFRGAKLWIALSFFQLKQHKKFYEIVEEFRLKYRNTPEWKLLSQHYEEFTHRYKE